MLPSLLVVALVASEPQTGLAAQYPGDKGIARDSAALFAPGFEDGFAGRTRVNAKIRAIEHDAPRAHFGAAFCRETATRGVDTGGEALWRLPQGVDRLYLRSYCRFAPDARWQHHFVKVRALAPGFDGNAGVAPPGDKGFWTGIEPLRETWRINMNWHRMRDWNNSGGDVAANDDGSKHSGKNDFYGNSFTPEEQPPVPKDTWICVEALLKAKTPGKSDGEVARWIDGRKVGHHRSGEPVGRWRRNALVTSGDQGTPPGPFPGFDFRTDPAPKISEIALQWCVSEEYAAEGTAVRNVVDFDDVVVATAYVGPMAAPMAR